MAVLGAWTSIADGDCSSDCTVQTTASRRGPYVAEGIVLGNDNVNAFAKFDAPAVSDFWLSWYTYYTTSASAGPFEYLILYGANLAPILRLANSTTTWIVALWNGSAWTTIGSGFARPAGAVLHKIDLRFKIADAGVVELYSDGGLIFSYSGDTLLTAVTQMTTIRFAPTYLGTSTDTVSAIVLADESTLDLVFAQNLPSGNGGQTAWANDYTAVDETGLNNFDFISSDTNDQVETMAFAALNSALNSYDVLAVVAAVNCRLGNSGPGQIAVVSRSGGTDYEAGGLSPEASRFRGKQLVIANNPATSTPYTVATLNASEMGVKSKAS